MGIADGFARTLAGQTETRLARLDCNRLRRAQGNTGTAAGTSIELQSWQRRATQLRRESDRLHCAGVTTSAADHALLRQTTVIYRGAVRPRWRSFVPMQCHGSASIDTVPTKSALTLAEINLWKACVTSDDDLGWA